MAKSSTNGPLRAAVYTRISNDPEGREKGVERQEQDCRALADTLRYEVVAVFEENDVSASTRSRKPRPEYEQMMVAAKTGQVDVILAYSNSRLTRRPMEVEDIIRLHEHHGVRVRTVVSGDDDLSTADGRMVARIKGNVDAAEAERTSERVRRAKAQAVAEGRYRGGKRPYGFAKDGVTIVPEEAAIIREMTTALLAGRSLRALAADLNARGVTSSQGKEWTHANLRDVLTRPRNAGKISKGQHSHGNFEVVGDAVWDAIVSEDEWRAVFDLLTDPARSTGTNGRRWLLTGIARCGVPTGEVDEDGKPKVCGAPMRITSTGGTPSRPGQTKRFHYRCGDRPHLLTSQEKVDEYILGEVVKLLNNPKIIEKMTPEGVDLSPEREERARLMARLAVFERDYALGDISGAQLSKSTALIEAQLADVDARLAKAIRRSTSSPIFQAADPGAAFLAAPLDVKRSVIASVMRIHIVPSTRRGAAWSPERLRLFPVGAVDTVDANAA